MNFEWLIIGGGLHGVHIASRLVAHAKISPNAVGIVDPGPRLLSRWQAMTQATGMRYLRSPSVHHIGLEAWSLIRYSGKVNQRPPGLFAPPYDRPCLELFNRHCQQVISDQKLGEQQIHARATQCQKHSQGFQVQLDTGDKVSGKRMVLAMGASEQPHWPDWVPILPGPIPVQHIFDPKGITLPTTQQRIAVIGGGISAAQVAAGFAAKGHGVELVSRHPLREHQFDSDPGWLGPKYMKGFARQRCVQERRAMITKARHRGSAPRDVLRTLAHHIHNSNLRVHEAGVRALSPRQGGLLLSNGVRLGVDQVFLATGFSPARPGGAMIDELIKSAGLSCAHCGYPVVNHDLEWHEHLYVTGPLAELELGPTSRNIAGARRAADRIVKVARVA